MPVEVRGPVLRPALRRLAFVASESSFGGQLSLGRHWPATLLKHLQLFPQTSALFDERRQSLLVPTDLARDLKISFGNDILEPMAGSFYPVLHLLPGNRIRPHQRAPHGLIFGLDKPQIQRHRRRPLQKDSSHLGDLAPEQRLLQAAAAQYVPLNLREIAHQKHFICSRGWEFVAQRLRQILELGGVFVELETGRSEQRRDEIAQLSE